MSAVKKLFEKQERYLKDRTPESLNDMTKEFYGLAFRALRNFEKQRPDIYISESRGEVAVNDSVSYLANRYISDPDFRIESNFYDYLRRNVRSNIWNRKLQRLDRYEGISLNYLSKNIYTIDKNIEDVPEKDLRERFKAALDQELDVLIAGRVSSRKDTELAVLYSLNLKKHIQKILKRDRIYYTYLYLIKDYQMRDDVREIMGKIKEWIKNYEGY